MKHHDKYIFELPIKVRDYEVDCQGIVNNANYLHYMEHTRHEFCEQAGLSFSRMHADGIDPVVRRAEIEFFTPLRLGELMVSRLWIERMGARFVFHQAIFHADGTTLAACADISIVTLVDGRLSRGDVLFDAFKDYLSQPGE